MNFLKVQRSENAKKKIMKVTGKLPKKKQKRTFVDFAEDFSLIGLTDNNDKVRKI